MSGVITYAPFGRPSPAIAYDYRSADALDRPLYAVTWALVFCIPWAEDVPFFAGLGLSRWIGLLAFTIALLRMGMTRQSRRLTVAHYWMWALVAWSTVSFAWSADTEGTALRIGTYLQLMAAVWLIWESSVMESRVIGFLQAFVLGTCVAAIVTLSNFIAGRTGADLYFESTGEHRWGAARYTMTGLNENDLGLILALGLAIAFYLQARLKGPITLLYAAYVPVAVTAILLTGSRGSLIATTAACVMYPLTFSKLSLRLRILSLMAVGAAVVAAMYVIPLETWQRLMSFGTEVSEGTLTHRTVIWAAGLQAFRDHAFLGVGAGAYGATVLKMIDIPYVSHNTYLSVLVELGAVGGLLLAGLLGSLIWCAVRVGGLERRLWLILLLTWGIGVSALTWEYRKPTWFLFAVIVAHVYSRRSELIQGLR